MNDQSWGIWEVTTEGDCEGRSVARLGIFEGHLDEIALHLADKAYYRLYFARYVQPIPNKGPFYPTKESVEVENFKKLDLFSLLRNRPVIVSGNGIKTLNKDQLRYGLLRKKNVTELSTDDLEFLLKMKKEYDK